jgi:Pentatricopeptide repeat domain
VHLLYADQVGAVDRAMEVFRQMQEVAVAPTIITFNSILDACARNGDAVRAAQVPYMHAYTWHVYHSTTCLNTMHIHIFLCCTQSYTAIVYIGGDMLKSLQYFSAYDNSSTYEDTSCAQAHP